MLDSNNYCKLKKKYCKCKDSKGNIIIKNIQLSFSMLNYSNLRKGQFLIKYPQGIFRDHFKKGTCGFWIEKKNKDHPFLIVVRCNYYFFLVNREKLVQLDRAEFLTQICCTLTHKYFCKLENCCISLSVGWNLWMIFNDNH